MICTLATLALLAADPAPAPAGAVSPAKQRVLVLDLRNDGVTPEQARLVTDSLSVSLSRFPSLDVVSREDLRRVLENESAKQAMGSCTDEGCLAELAGALDADRVFYGSIGRLDTLVVVNLNLFDAKTQRSIARQSVRAESLDKLPPLLDQALAQMLGEQPSAHSAPPAPDPKAGGDGPNRVLAGVVAGGVGACVGMPMLAALGFFGPCGLCPGTLCAAGLGAGASAAGVAVGGGGMKQSLVPIAIAAGGGVIGAMGALGVYVVGNSIINAGKSPQQILAENNPLPAIVGAGAGLAAGLVLGAVAGGVTAALIAPEEPAAP